jgi:cytochrome bd-type quinol oxidase subunit 1
MNTDLKAGMFIGMFFGLLIAVAAFLWGTALAREQIRDQAIKAGAAEWQANPTTGEVKLVWLPEKKP